MLRGKAESPVPITGLPFQVFLALHRFQIPSSRQRIGQPVQRGVVRRDGIDRISVPYDVGHRSSRDACRVAQHGELACATWFQVLDASIDNPAYNPIESAVSAGLIGQPDARPNRRRDCPAPTSHQHPETNQQQQQRRRAMKCYLCKSCSSRSRSIDHRLPPDARGRPRATSHKVQSQAFCRPLLPRRPIGRMNRNNRLQTAGTDYSQATRRALQTNLAPKPSITVPATRSIRDFIAIYPACALGVEIRVPSVP